MTNILKIFGITLAILIGPFSVVTQAQNSQYHFQLTASSGPYPTIRGTTDMPDGTKLLVTVMKPHLPDGQQRMARGLPACEDMCGPADTHQKPYVDPVVKNGVFVAGPFSFGEQPIKPDRYPIRISVIPQVLTDAGWDAVKNQIYTSEIWLPGNTQKIGDSPEQYKPKWQRFEADNGAAFALDTGSVAHLYYCNGCADAVVCTLDNETCLPQNMRRIRFDCHGHYEDVMSSGGMLIAPPRSVVGQIATKACVGAREY